MLRRRALHVNKTIRGCLFLWIKKSENIFSIFRSGDFWRAFADHSLIGSTVSAVETETIVFPSIFPMMEAGVLKETART
jgi:hypothetical protein